MLINKIIRKYFHRLYSYKTNKNWYY